MERTNERVKARLLAAEGVDPLVVVHVAAEETELDTFRPPGPAEIDRPISKSAVTLFAACARIRHDEGWKIFIPERAGAYRASAHEGFNEESAHVPSSP